jgi:hypothetical protein
MIYGAEGWSGPPIVYILCAKHPLLATIGSPRLSMNIRPSASAARCAHNTFSAIDWRSSAVLEFGRGLAPRVAWCETKMNTTRSFSFFRRDALCSSTGAFSLMEVMIASGIFFLATFTVLALVSAALRNARALQRGDVDAAMAASQVYQLLKTNRQAEVSGSGDFGTAYPDYSFEFASGQYQSNGLLQVEIVVKRRGSRKPVDTAIVWVYAPEAKSSLGQPNLR